MKTIKFSILISILLIIASINDLKAQDPTSIQNESPKIFLVEKQDGIKFIGEILTRDAREILIKTVDLGEIYIPMHLIKEIREILPSSNNLYISDELFSTRYFITTNGLPIKKGENYIQWNLYGPDFQFGIADNFGVGVMTSWAAIPIIATAKYSIKLGEKTNMAVGLLAGTGSWALPEFGLLLPYVAFTLGDRRNNLTFSTGYGGLFLRDENYNPLTDTYENERRTEGRMLISIAGMAKFSDKFSIVFDTFISPWGPDYTYTNYEDNGYWNENTNEYIPNYQEKTYTEKSPNLAIILPGIRWQIDSERAFQFGFTGFFFDGEFIQAPIPMVQWYRKL